MSPSDNSTTLTRLPNASYTVPISSPIMPPPTMSKRLGMSFSSSAPVESIIRGSSFTPGNFVACDPAATIQCSKPIVSELPSAFVTLI